MNYPTTPEPINSYYRVIQFRTLVHTFENGNEQRLSLWPAVGRGIFRLVYEGLNETEMNTLWNFYISTQGIKTSFNFADTFSGTTYAVRFANDKLTMEQFYLRSHRASIDLIEVFGE